ncbi:hypothetical protein NBO_856g0002 [Nosema bombycis CQ1]|uniref:Uncharacterized protein n=1 Tax=Nosema bombycis (strain CQ1 / CVCC 102059) TaxID=578461 RepID=R0M175_NOSB1|nr:hypothetical protein NBO_856g0002 [Nosema bombycis CQ1]|eukprot:EOB11779.1 hypothetical protein NBO_856g0002 [Nosema bombycis CQ1]
MSILILLIPPLNTPGLPSFLLIIFCIKNSLKFPKAKKFLLSLRSLGIERVQKFNFIYLMVFI